MDWTPIGLRDSGVFGGRVVRSGDHLTVGWCRATVVGFEIDGTMIVKDDRTGTLGSYRHIPVE